MPDKGRPSKNEGNGEGAMWCKTISYLMIVVSLWSSEDAFSNTNQLKELGELPLYFIENNGQLDSQVAYYVQGSDKAIYFTAQGITLALTDSEAGSRWAVKLDFIDCQIGSKPEGLDKQEAIFSYFTGKPQDWTSGAPTYGRLVYSDLWPGINLVYSGNVNNLKYEFIVKPGADPSMIKLRYRGASGLKINSTGSLRISTPAGDFEDGKPFAYQMINGCKKEVYMRYKLEGELDYTFEIGGYDPEYPLILDPVLLVYCGFIGGSGIDEGCAVALDGMGSAHVAGFTQSSQASFPQSHGPDLTWNGQSDAFVAKVSADGAGLYFCGFIGGNKDDKAFGVAVDHYGYTYIAGETSSTEATFPVKGGPDLTYNDLGDGFIAKINYDGTSLVYCGYLGGDDADSCSAIVVDSLSRPFVTGFTRSDEDSFPVEVGPDLTFNGKDDAFIAQLKSNGTSFDYCGYIGGDESEEGKDIEVDGSGKAVVAGWTRSAQATFPVKDGPGLLYRGACDAFVAKIEVGGTGFDFCGYIGGENFDEANGVFLDYNKNVYLAGKTLSSETTFPVAKGPDLTHNGGADAFVAKIKYSDSSIDFCGYLGGGSDDCAEDIGLDAKGDVYLAGWTLSDQTSFPIAKGPDLTHNGQEDAFIAKLTGKGTDLSYCGFIGGAGSDAGLSLAVDFAGNAFITGRTSSSEKNSGFPVIEGPCLTYSGACDAFISRISYMTLLVDKKTVSANAGEKATFVLNAGKENKNRYYLLLANMSGQTPGIPLPDGQTIIPLNWDLFTTLVLIQTNSSFFYHFMGKLDSNGSADAHFNNSSAPLPYAAVGLIMNFAYILRSPLNFASNPVTVVIVP